MAKDRFNSEFNSRHAFLFFLLSLFGIILLSFVALGIFHVGGVPEIKIEPGMQAIGKRTPLKIEVSETRRGLTNVRVELLQGNRSMKLIEMSYPHRSQFSFWSEITGRDTFNLEVGKQTLPALTGGTAIIRVTAERANTWMRSPDPLVKELMLPVRLIPPAIQITSIQTYVAQGGCEAVVYRVGESAVRDGVRAGSWWFPGFPLPGGGRQDRFAVFAVPYDMGQPEVRLIAVDGAGNEAEMGFIDKFFPKPFRSDSMEVSDAFMNKVVPAILSQTPELNDRGNLLDNYLAINRELRKKDADILKTLAEKSKPAFLWNQPFLMMPNGKVMAAFADRRIYQYQGRTIDLQDHLGIDFAATQQALIPAANDGIVLYARFFGIYGNAVVIDHGYGLSTIYGHMSSIAVTEGQKIARGAIIGKTGETGLAGGDHLHFSTILQGLPVNPIEWSDGHWIQDRIARKLGPAFQSQKP